MCVLGGMGFRVCLLIGKVCLGDWGVLVREGKMGVIVGRVVGGVVGYVVLELGVGKEGGEE